MRYDHHHRQTWQSGWSLHHPAESWRHLRAGWEERRGEPRMRLYHSTRYSMQSQKHTHWIAIYTECELIWLLMLTCVGAVWISAWIQQGQVLPNPQIWGFTARNRSCQRFLLSSSLFSISLYIIKYKLSWVICSDLHVHTPKWPFFFTYLEYARCFVLCDYSSHFSQSDYCYTAETCYFTTHSHTFVVHRSPGGEVAVVSSEAKRLLLSAI